MVAKIDIPSTLHLLLSDQWNIREEGRGVLEIDGNSITTSIPAYKGEPGDPGRDGLPPRFREPVGEDELPDIGDLSPSDIGWFWPIAGTSDVLTYNGLDLVRISDYFGGDGPVGPAPKVQIGGVQVGPVPAVTVVDDGQTNGTATINFTLPEPRQGERGKEGPTGPAADIEASADYDDHGTPATAGQVLTKHTDGTWYPATMQLSPGVVKKSAADSDWKALDSGINWRGDTLQAVVVNVPAQAFPWEPEIFGAIDVKTDGIGLVVDAEVRLGAASGPLVAKGPGNQNEQILGEWQTRSIVPAADGSSPLGESNTIVPAGTGVDFYVLLRRRYSATGVTVKSRKDNGFLRIKVEPVVTK
jgi:hypothetical protein